MVHNSIIIPNNSSSLSRRNMFGVLETETAQITQRATHLAIVFGQPGLAGILNNGKFMLLSNGQNSIHIGRQSKNMDRENGPGTFGDLLFNFVWIYGKCFLIGIGKNRQCLLVENHIVGGNEGIRRDNNLIAGIDRPDSGGIVLEGTDIANLSRSRLAAWRAEKLTRPYPGA